MNEVKSFTCSVLAELASRMKNTNRKLQIRKDTPSLKEMMTAPKEMMTAPREMKTLEELIKNTSNGSKASLIKDSCCSSTISESKKVITQKDMENMGDIRELQISKGDIITPLAQDLLKRKKIKLIVI